MAFDCIRQLFRRKWPFKYYLISGFDYKTFLEIDKKSQFFLTYAKHNTLDMKYTVFGKMIDGDETLDAIEKVLIDPKVFVPTELRL